MIDLAQLGLFKVLVGETCRLSRSLSAVLYDPKPSSILRQWYILEDVIEVRLSRRLEV
jgi:hypothetical protein